MYTHNFRRYECDVVVWRCEESIEYHEEEQEVYIIHIIMQKYRNSMRDKQQLQQTTNYIMTSTERKTFLCVN